MASNTPQAQSVLMQPGRPAPRPAAGRELQADSSSRSTSSTWTSATSTSRSSGPRPFLMMGWMPQDILESWTRLTNDAIGKQVSYFPDRFLASMQLPQNPNAPDTKHCIDEIERCQKEWGVMSVYVGPDPEGLRRTPGMDKPYWYDLYAKCERDGLPIIVHGTNHQDPRLSHHQPELPGRLPGRAVHRHAAPRLQRRLRPLPGAEGHRLSLRRRPEPLRADRQPQLPARHEQQPVLRHLCLRADLPQAAFAQKGVSQMVFGTEAPGSGRHVDPRTGRSGDNVVPTLAGGRVPHGRGPHERHPQQPAARSACLRQGRLSRFGSGNDRGGRPNGLPPLRFRLKERGLGRGLSCCRG